MEAERMTLRQIYPICGIGDDSTIRLHIHTKTATTKIHMRKTEIEKLLSEQALNGRIGCITTNETYIEITVYAEKDDDDGEKEENA